MPLRVLIVDDEPLARRRVSLFLAPEPDVEVVGECGDGEEAVRAIDALAPDVVFLDVQMPEMDGFEVLAALPPGREPTVVFVTAYDEFALRAFNANAADYLLKPYGEDRFRAALDRARARVGPAGQAEVSRQIQSLLATLHAERQYPERLVVRVGPKIQFVRVRDVDWVEAEGNYVCVHARGREHLLRETLTHLAERLPPDRFLRVHRSAVVNVDRIREVVPMTKGTYQLRLEDGSALTSTATYRDGIQALIDGGV